MPSTKRQWTPRRRKNLREALKASWRRRKRAWARGQTYIPLAAR
jgi:hypothetical protein